MSFEGIAGTARAPRFDGRPAWAASALALSAPGDLLRDSSGGSIGRGDGVAFYASSWGRYRYLEDLDERDRSLATAWQTYVDRSGAANCSGRTARSSRRARRRSSAS